MGERVPTPEQMKSEVEQKEWKRVGSLLTKPTGFPGEYTMVVIADLDKSSDKPQQESPNA